MQNFKGRMDEERYIVLSGGEQFFVCFRRELAPKWLQVIGTFTCEDRANDYADVQNMFLDDLGLELDKDVQVPVPKIPQPRDALKITASETRTRETVRRAVIAEPVREPVTAIESEAEVVREIAASFEEPLEEPEVERQTVVETQPEAPPESEFLEDEPEAEPVAEAGPEDPPAEISDILEDEPIETDDDSSEGDDAAPPGVAGKIPDLILRFLPGFMVKYPDGPTIKQVVAETKLIEADVREAFNVLRAGGAVVYLAREDHALHVAPLGFDAPALPELSGNQGAVLQYLTGLEPDKDGAVTPPSRTHMAETTGVPNGSTGQALYELEKKGKIEVVQRGTSGGVHGAKPRYRVVNRSILQQALRARETVRDATHLVADDPHPDRVALAAARRALQRQPDE